MEYSVNITGSPPPIHNVTWMRMQVLAVDGPAFPVNLTVRYVNGTYYSSIWKFNFTAGNDEGWLIIPPNLSPGGKFYDAYSKTDKNITIQRQQQLTVLKASRTVTFGNQSNRYKEWDKTTGVFLWSSETFKNWNATVNMIATNLWTPQTESLNQSATYWTAGTLTVVVAAIAVAFTIAKRRKTS